MSSRNLPKLVAPPETESKFRGSPLREIGGFLGTYRGLRTDHANRMLFRARSSPYR